MMRKMTFACLVVGIALTLGCDKKPAEKAPEKAPEKVAEKVAEKAPEKVAEKAPEPVAAKAEEPKKEVELAELDLGSGGAAWKGWTIKAPAGSTVMKDIAGLRIAGKGCPITETCPAFDLIVKQGKPDLKGAKKLQTKGAAQYKDKIEFTKDTAELLEWSRTGETGKSINFLRALKVGKKEVGCHPFGSVVHEADLSAMQAACESLAKK